MDYILGSHQLEISFKIANSLSLKPWFEVEVILITKAFKISIVVYQNYSEQKKNDFISNIEWLLILLLLLYLYCR